MSLETVAHNVRAAQACAIPPVVRVPGAGPGHHNNKVPFSNFQHTSHPQCCSLDACEIASRRSCECWIWVAPLSLYLASRQRINSKKQLPRAFSLRQVCAETQDKTPLGVVEFAHCRIELPQIHEREPGTVRGADVNLDFFFAPACLLALHLHRRGGRVSWRKSFRESRQARSRGPIGLPFSQ